MEINTCFLMQVCFVCISDVGLFLCKKQKQGVGGEELVSVVLYVKTNATTNSTGFCSHRF